MKLDKEKEFSKMFRGLGVAQSVTISKPRHVRRVGFVALVIALAFVLFGLFFWHISGTHGNLARNISSRSQFYLFLKIPNNDSTQLSRLYTKFVQVNSGEIYGSKAVLSMLESNIEIAKFDTGEVVLMSKLKDKTEWLSLMETSEEKSTQINNLNIDAPKLLELLEPNSNWFWYIEKDKLYIVSNESVREKLKFDIEISVSKMINASRKDFMAMYLGNTSELSNMQNPYVSLLADSASETFIFYAGLDHNQIIFRTNDLPDANKNLTENAIKKLYKLSNFDIKAYIGDIKSSNINFEENVAQVLNQIQEFLNKTNGIDIAKLDKKSAFSNFAIFISPKNEQKTEENDWLIVSESLELDMLEQFGLSNFAKHHPIRVEKVLRDGSVMIEMRAKEEGLLWEDLDIMFNNQYINFKSLQSQGEEGYFVGNISGLGNVLASSETILNRILENYSGISKIIVDNECKLDFLSKISVHLNMSSLSNDQDILSILDYVDILSSENGDLYGCAVFNEY